MSASETEAGTSCPHCGADTGIPRTGVLVLPGPLYADEFEILVRNEWRRRLGPSAYVRAHEARLIRALAAVVMSSGKVDGTEVLARELESVLADLVVAGGGRPHVRREMRLLVKAIRTVLTNAGAAPMVVEGFVETARAALDRALDYPVPPPARS